MELIFQAVLSQLDAETGQIQSDIQTGRKLEKSPDVPSFVHGTVNTLETQFQQSAVIAQEKYEELKSTLVAMETYTVEKAKVLEAVRKAESEIIKSPPAAGKQVLQRDAEAKKVTKTPTRQPQSHLNNSV